MNVILLILGVETLYVLGWIGNEPLFRLGMGRSLDLNGWQFNKHHTDLIRHNSNRKCEHPMRVQIPGKHANTTIIKIVVLIVLYISIATLIGLSLYRHHHSLPRYYDKRIHDIRVFAQTYNNLTIRKEPEQVSESMVYERLSKDGIELKHPLSINKDDVCYVLINGIPKGYRDRAHSFGMEKDEVFVMENENVDAKEKVGLYIGGQIGRFERVK